MSGPASSYKARLGGYMAERRNFLLFGRWAAVVRPNAPDFRGGKQTNVRHRFFLVQLCEWTKLGILV